MTMMKNIEEIERDVEFQILNNRQTQILEESTKNGVECSQFVKEWSENLDKIEVLKTKGCKRN